MKLKNAIILGAAAALVFLFLSGLFPVDAPVPDTGETAVVTFVIDGDTVELDSGERVRYIGIDTPEITHTPFEEPDCYGPEAAARNRELVLGKEVTLVMDTTDRDQYGRSLRYVYVEETFVNHQLVEEGYARAIFIRPDIQHYSTLKSAQEEARKEGRGLWGNCS